MADARQLLALGRVAGRSADRIGAVSAAVPDVVPGHVPDAVLPPPFHNPLFLPLASLLRQLPPRPDAAALAALAATRDVRTAGGLPLVLGDDVVRTNV